MFRIQTGKARDGRRHVSDPAGLTRVCRFVAALLLAIALPASAAPQLRNLVAIEGVRDNPLVGYGLVVGLNGSGDSTQVKFASQSVVNMLKQFGVKMPDGADAKSKNVAAVMVSAVFPPGYRRGQPIDVTVSSLGDAKSLRGGSLLLTPLKAADNEVYALAQGNVVVGGLSASGKSGSSVTVNTPTAGRIPNGAVIEREIATDFATKPSVHLSLKQPNFETATNIVEAINRKFGNVASTADGTGIDVLAPENPTQRVAFMAKLEALPIEVGQEVPESGVQLAHRHRGDRRRPAREGRRRHPRLAQGCHFGKLEGQPACALQPGPDRSDAAIERGRK